MSKEPYIKGTICEVKGTKLEVKIIGQKLGSKGFVYDVEHLSKNKDEKKTQYASIEIQPKTMGNMRR